MNSDYGDITAMDFNIPVRIVGKDIVLALGITNAETDTGEFLTQHFDDGSSKVIASADGSANYLNVGARYRKLLIDGGCQLSGDFIGDYNFRLGGSTEYGKWSQEKNEELYDPIGGLNLGGGIGCSFGRDDSSVNVGLRQMYNVDNHDGQTYITFRVEWK